MIPDPLPLEHYLKLAEETYERISKEEQREWDAGNVLAANDLYSDVLHWGRQVNEYKQKIKERDTAVPPEPAKPPVTTEKRTKSRYRNPDSALDRQLAGFRTKQPRGGPESEG